jgi:DNA-binding CsgD family transcriptional regulator
MKDKYEIAPPLFSVTKEELMAKTTLRERRVLALAAQEMSNKEIAEELGISEQTVKRHRKNALKKLDLHGKADFRRLLHLLT